MNTDDQKRIRIAEFCGWDIHDWGVTTPDGREVGRGYNPIEGMYPDYLNSLDAIAEAEVRLTDEQKDKYLLELTSICWNCRECSDHFHVFSIYTATARQRAEALLKIIQS